MSSAAIDLADRAATLSSRLVEIYYFWLTGLHPTDEFYDLEDPLASFPPVTEFHHGSTIFHRRFRYHLSNFDTIRALFEEHLASDESLNPELINCLDDFFTRVDELERDSDLSLMEENRSALKEWIGNVLVLIGQLRHLLVRINISFTSQSL